MRSEFSANLAMQNQPADWRALLAKRETNRATRKTRVAQTARSLSFGAILLGSIGSAVAQVLGRSV